MHLIYEALKKTGGKTDGDALIGAMKGMKWESPRGPISIDPDTRDIVQNIYIGKVEKVNGQLYTSSSRPSSGQGSAEDEEISAQSLRYPPTIFRRRLERLHAGRRRRKTVVHEEDDAIVRGATPLRAMRHRG